MSASSGRYDAARGLAGACVLFVYGSLKRGGQHHAMLGDAEYLGIGVTPPHYWLVDLGEYPALVAGGSTAVQGEIYRIDAATLARLDALEEHPTLYVRTCVHLADGRAVDTYLLPAACAAGFPIVAGGLWVPR